jgi:hypothetical protein
MPVRFIFCLALVLCLSGYAQSQTKTFVNYEQIWLGYMNQTRFSQRWGIWADVQLRSKDDFVDSMSTGILRAGLTYYIKDQLKVTAGYAFINHFPGDNHRDISQPEHRFWQQLQAHGGGGRVKTMQWLRLEERFRRKIASDDALAEGYTFNFRVRYNYLVQWAIGKRPFAPRTFSFVLNDEVHINFGKQIIYNTFDQNRFFAGFHYFISSHTFLQFGYMNLVQQLASGTTYRNVHAARVLLFQNLDFSPKRH